MGGSERSGMRCMRRVPGWMTPFVTLHSAHNRRQRGVTSIVAIIPLSSWDNR